MTDAVDTLFDWRDEKEREERRPLPVECVGKPRGPAQLPWPPHEVTEEELTNGPIRKCKKCGETYPETNEFFEFIHAHIRIRKGRSRREKARWSNACRGCSRVEDRKREKRRDYYTFKKRCSRIRNAGRQRGIKWTFDGPHREVLRKFYDAPCHYCGREVEQRLGLDRVDNAKGYVPGNVVQCCTACNLMKASHSVDEWTVHMERVLDHLNHRSVSEEPTGLRRNDAESVPERTLFFGKVQVVV
jgi:hypothetical protein